VTLSGKTPAIGGWLNANLTFLAEFNAARKILMRQLQKAAVDPTDLRDLRTTASELHGTTLVLRALPPIPDEIASFQFEASLDAFDAALNEIVRGHDETSTTEGAALSSAGGLMVQSMARYRAATQAIAGAVAR
jgi:hypothetical protein